MSKSFVHLHSHTEYSMLDGAARIDDMVKACVELGMPAVAATDHGNMFGAFELYKKARAAGIKPIIGIEAYLAPNVHRSVKEKVLWGQGGEDDISGGGAYTHMTMLAENKAGLHNLFRLSSLASMEGMYYKPRMDRELLSQYGEGIIATTGCPSGEIQTRIRRGEYELAREAAGEFRDIFGAGNFFVELMDHDLDMEKRAKDDLLRLAKDLNLPLLATNDLHYVSKDDAGHHEALLCVQVGKTLNDPSRFKFDGTGYYLKSPDEMRYLFRELPGACDNTLVVAERCDVWFDEDTNYMPRFDVPPWVTEEEHLRNEAWTGSYDRYGDELPREVMDRLDYELRVICDMGFPSYFLVVADFIKWAKSQGIRVGPGRGSAAGSLVAYALGITDLDPMAHGLMFERFLNPDRVSMPDIDIDFDERRRDEVIAYVKEKYGEDHVAQIVTYGTIKAKAAIKDAARVHGYSYQLGNALSALVPKPIAGKDISLAEVYDPEHPRYKDGEALRAEAGRTDANRTILHTARGLEGLKRSSGVHAAGVILSSEPLIDLIPLQKRAYDGAIVTQFDMGACEALGLLKMDFLGLRNLTVIDDCLAYLRARGVQVSLEGLSLDDTATFRLLAAGSTLGVFQLDSGPMRELLQAMQPTSFNDISAVLALYRPGPMGANAHTDYAARKNGRQPITPIHPELAEPLKEILAETYGLIVYQEQVMAIAQKVAGYSLSQADLLRRAMGKKKKEILDKEYEPFAAGMAQNGYSEDAIRTLWEILVPFSDYAFNKAHSAGYGLVSYWTAYLKANYPAEYMAALLTSVAGDKDKNGEPKSALYLAEAARIGVPVLPPDVNESVAQYTPTAHGTIRFGLASIKGVGEAVVEQIVATRQSGAFTSFADFIARVPSQVRNKRTIEALIKAGAFDSLGHTRRSLLVLSDALLGTQPAGLYIGPTCASVVVSTEELSERTLLAFEREMLGLTVSNQRHEVKVVRFSLPASAMTERTMEEVCKLAQSQPGTADVLLYVQGPARTSVLWLGEQLRVTPSEELRVQLEALGQTA